MTQPINAITLDNVQVVERTAQALRRLDEEADDGLPVGSPRRGQVDLELHGPGGTSSVPSTFTGDRTGDAQ